MSKGLNEVIQQVTLFGVADEATQDNPHKRRAARGGRARDRVRLAKRQAEVAKLNLDGWTQTEIAQKFRVDIAQVSRDLKTMRQEWARESRGTTDEHVRRLASLQRDEKDVREHLASIEEQERATLREIERLKAAGDEDSLKGAVALTVALFKRDDHKSVKGYHETLLKIREARRKLLGLDAPTKVESKVETSGPTSVRIVYQDNWQPAAVEVVPAPVLENRVLEQLNGNGHANGNGASG